VHDVIATRAYLTDLADRNGLSGLRADDLHLDVRIGVPMVLALSVMVSVAQVIKATGEHSVWPNTIVKGAPAVVRDSGQRSGGRTGASRRYR